MKIESKSLLSYSSDYISKLHYKMLYRKGHWEIKDSCYTHMLILFPEYYDILFNRLIEERINTVV